MLPARAPLPPSACAFTVSAGALRHGRCLPQRNTHYQAGATPFLGRTLTGWNSLASDGYEINGVLQADQLRAMVARLQSSSR